MNPLAQFKAVLHTISNVLTDTVTRGVKTAGQRKRVLTVLALPLMAIPLPAWALTRVLRPNLDSLETAYVLSIVDNNTLLMQVEGHAEIQVVQLLGIDPLPPLTPSWTVLTGEPALPTYEAGQYMQDNLAFKQVYLEIDQAVISPDGVLPAYIWRGERLINQEMLFLGHGLLSDEPAPIKYDAVLVEAQETAQRQGRGVWSFYGPQPVSDQ